MIRHLVRSAAATALALGLSCLPAFAGTANSNFTVSDTLVNTCTISSPVALAFANFTGAAQQTSAGALSVQCTTGDPYTLTASTGANPTHAVGTTRAMANGTNYLSYELYTSNTYATVWNGVNTIGGTGNGLAQTLTVYGTIPAQAIPAAGAYTDTVNAVVTF